MNSLSRSVSDMPEASLRCRNHSKPPVWLYSHPSMKNLAKVVAKLCEGNGLNLSQASEPVPKRQYKGKRIVEFKDTINWSNFNDGFPNLFIEDVKKMAGKDVIFLASFHSPDIIFEQLSVVYAIPKYLAKSFTLILPYFPTGTMERVDTEGQIATAKTLATMLSSIPLTARGPSQIMVFDIHALQERFYFTESVIPRLESAIPLLLRKISRLAADEKIAITFPDDGAHKRFSSFFKQFPTIICFKIRAGDKRIVKIKDGQPKGYHVIIVDDLIQTGGTLLECARALHQSGAYKVSAYVTHPVFPKQSWQRFTTTAGAAQTATEQNDVQLEHFWITDSLPHAPFIAEHPPFELLSLADRIADVLLCYDLVDHD